jgi:hypothetical protein
VVCGNGGLARGRPLRHSGHAARPGNGLLHPRPERHRRRHPKLSSNGHGASHPHARADVRPHARADRDRSAESIAYCRCRPHALAFSFTGTLTTSDTGSDRDATTRADSTAEAGRGDGADRRLEERSCRATESGLSTRVPDQGEPGQPQHDRVDLSPTGRSVLRRYRSGGVLCDGGRRRAGRVPAEPGLAFQRRAM